MKAFHEVGTEQLLWGEKIAMNMSSFVPQFAPRTTFSALQNPGLCFRALPCLGTCHGTDHRPRVAVARLSPTARLQTQPLEAKQKKCEYNFNTTIVTWKNASSRTVLLCILVLTCTSCFDNR